MTLAVGPQAGLGDPGTLNALVSVYEVALRLLSPFMPFLTEEIWHALYAALGEPRLPARSIALTRYPQAAEFATDVRAEKEMTYSAGGHRFGACAA